MPHLSSIEKKAVMGMTGLLLLGFVVMHLLGNLLIFAGPEALNAYAEKLRHAGALLWVARGVLLTAAALHIWLGLVLAQENRAARPVAYAVSQSARTTAPAKTMAISGLLLAAFIVYHLLHFTFRITHPELSHLSDAQGRHDVFSMVVGSFQAPWLAAAYVVAMGLLCAHLAHGAGSWLQSLGLNNDRLLPVVERLGHAAAWLIFLGYSAIPVSILFGVIH